MQAAAPINQTTIHRARMESVPSNLGAMISMMAGSYRRERPLPHAVAAQTLFNRSVRQPGCSTCPNGKMLRHSRGQGPRNNRSATLADLHILGLTTGSGNWEACTDSSKYSDRSFQGGFKKRIGAAADFATLSHFTTPPTHRNSPRLKNLHSLTSNGDKLGGNNRICRKYRGRVTATSGLVFWQMGL